MTCKYCSEPYDLATPLHEGFCPKCAETKRTGHLNTLERRFIELESNVAKCRAFVEKHKDAMGAFDCTCYGWDTEIKFSQYMILPFIPKDVARAFGVDGWKRIPNTSGCGSIDWVKELDGVVLKIENAEQIKPKLIEEVKL
jgi:hypothetical protein